VHRHALGAQVGDVARAGDPGEEGAVGDRREDLAVADHEDVGRRRLRHVAERVGHERVAEALGARLGEHPRVVRIETARLGVDHRVLEHGPAEARRRQRRRGLRRGHRDLLERDAEARRARFRHDAQIAPLERPVHRPDIDRRVRRVAPQPRPHDLDHLVGVHRGLDHQRLGRAVHARAMRAQVRRDPLRVTRPVEDGRAQPRAVIARAHDHRVAVVPGALEKGAQVLAGRHARDPPRCVAAGA